MKTIRLYAVVLLSVLATSLFVIVPSGYADEWDKTTSIQISGGSLQMPGIVLPPGEYVFKLAGATDRHIVQVFNADRSRLMTTLLAIPNYRLERTEDTQFMFWETPAGRRVALRAWFYPGDNTGQEFPYSDEEFALISAAMREKAVEQIAEAPKPAEEKVEIAEVRQPTPEPVAPTPVAPTEELSAAQATPQEGIPSPPSAAQYPETMAQASSSDEKAGMERQEELPRTASYLPLIALLGLLSVGSALIVRRVRC